MARPRVNSYEDRLEPKPDAMDFALSSSWPAAVPSAHLPEPPRPPLRKPSSADWEVTPLHLPTVPRKRTTSGSSNTTTREGATSAETGVPVGGEAYEKSDIDEEEDDEGVFAFDAAQETEEYYQLALTGFDDKVDQDLSVPFQVLGGAEDAFGAERMVSCTRQADSFENTAGLRRRSLSMSPKVGASPALLSALERVALEAGNNGRARYMS
mmetsp:Transcript_84188/g.234769  ORF Transcript_84188/g.234769 Transcript_84188/m.234769 type:complete len:211 (-) Transcript_84188:95-727(-)